MAHRIERLHIYIGRYEQIRATLKSFFDAENRAVEFVDEENLGANIADVEVLLCGIAPKIDWSAAKRLRLLHFMGAGIDHLWPAVGLDPSVVIANARGMHAMEMRDHTLAMMLAFERELPRAVEQQRSKQWVPFVAGTLAGKTLGILGLGEVGLPIARAAKALGMRVIGMRNRPIPTPEVDQIILPDNLSTMLNKVDYLVVTAPLTSRTRGLLGARELAQLGSHAVLVVISRGGIVDEFALAEALREGRLRGAALDVFAEEPLPETSPLWTTPNLVLTPHISGWMADYLRRAVQIFLTNLERFERGEEVLTLVDRNREY